MLNQIKNPSSYQIDGDGHKLLSTHWDSFNKILVSDKMRAKFESEYMKSTAAINEITYGADQLLDKMMTSENLAAVNQSIKNLKMVYSSIDFDPMYLYSMLESAGKQLKSEHVLSPSEEEVKIATLMPKESILISAEPTLGEIKEWPETFKRKEKKDIEFVPPQEKPQLISEAQLYDPSQHEETEYISTSELIDQEQDESFQLRTVKSEKVDIKPLPTPPEGDPEEILLYVKYILDEGFDMKSFAMACGLARDNLRKIMLQSDYMWELSKYERMYRTKPIGMSMPLKDKKKIVQKLDKWIKELEEERLEQERLEKERLEQERLEKERLERERQEQERLEREREERERLEQERKRLEEERKEAERLEKIRAQKERVRKEREKLKREEEEKERQRQEQLRLEQERQEKIRKEKEKLEQERLQLEKIEKEKRELKKLKKKQKRLKKQEKARRKREKKLRKLQKKREKERRKLEELKDS